MPFTDRLGVLTIDKASLGRIECVRVECVRAGLEGPYDVEVSAGDAPE
jgi:hypothetical protein